MHVGGGIVSTKKTKTGHTLCGMAMGTSKLVEGLGRPQVVHHRRPRAGRVAEDGDGEEGHEVVDHAESSYEGAARQDVDRGRDKEACGGWDVWKEDVSACGIADARDELDGHVDEVKDEKSRGGRSARSRRGKGRVGSDVYTPSPKSHPRPHMENMSSRAS